MRLGVFGGSFDPLHMGHLVLAEQCREQANLDRILFVPCSTGPHKQDGPRATDRQRTEMLEIGIAGHVGFEVSDMEIKRGGVSYTIDTLKQLRTDRPEDELFLLMGDDSLENFSTWKSPQELCELATVLVVSRPGSGEVDLSVLEQFVDQERFQLFCDSKIESRDIEISSSDIRTRVNAGRSVRYLLPRAVQKYIETQKIYLDK